MNYKLRPWQPSDAASLAKHANNPKIAQFMTNGFSHPYTVEHAHQFIKFAMQKNPTAIFAIEVDGQAVGGVGLHAQGDIHCKNMELGYWLSEDYWGKGIVSKAVQEMIEYGFKTWDIQRIFARPFGTNIASQKVLEKAGFKLEGRFEKTLFKNGAFVDELIYAIRR